jgi:hypothetical protein
MAGFSRRTTLVLVGAFLTLIAASVAFQQYAAYEQTQRDAAAVQWAAEATSPQTSSECLARRRDLAKAVDLYHAAHQGGAQPGITDLAAYGATMTDCPVSSGVYSMTSGGDIVCSIHGGGS